MIIIDELDIWPWDSNTDLSFRGCLFGAVKPTKNADHDKYPYSGKCVEFYSIHVHLF